MLSTAATGTCVAERFVLEVLAGSGGMGNVYRARDLRTGETIALKLLQANPSPQEAERFAREAELLARLQHPGIVAYHAHGMTQAGEPYLAMEWMEGEDLSKRLSRGALSLSETLTLLRLVAEALAVAHEHGVVHRDVKPSNLFLRHGRVERVALLDFGIAWRTALSQPLTRTGIVMGTPAYMAPEQARGGRDLTPAVDVFALGCVLFECLTGEPPFVAERALAVLAKVLFDEPPKLRELVPEMPEAVEVLLKRMLEKNKANRLSDAASILIALNALDVTSLDASRELASTSSRARLVDEEQHLISVLLATPPPDPSEPLDIMDLSMRDQELDDPVAVLTQHGAHVEVLVDGSLVATLAHAHGAATDQAAHAARCALLVRARWPGAMIALSTGRGLLHERLPVGEVLDRAAALLRDHAADGSPSEQILLDEVTCGLLNVRFRTLRTPAGTCVLTGEDMELDVSRPLLGKPTPCVGRDIELGVLLGTLSGCIETSESHAVLVTAAAGMGKSRLRHELLRRVETQDEDVLILIGRGDPMSAGSSYGLLGQALRRLCGIQGGERLEVRRAKLAQRIGQHLPAAERGRVAAFLGEVCGAPFRAENDVKTRVTRPDSLVMNDPITQAFLDFLRAECRQHPTLLVLEDLQWGDALTVKLCEAALRKLHDCPLMVLALGRPEVTSLYPWLLSGAVQVLPLRPLSRKAGERLVQQVLGKQVPKETVARIVEQSQGNMLFLEELIRLEADGRGEEAPETVLAMLQARIGRLPAGARHVLRAASVFGGASWLGGICALLSGSFEGQDIEGCLLRLLQDEILEERTLSRFPEEREYRFRHDLMRDAAYGLLTAEDRAEAHRIAGEFLEARGEPDALVLAEHYQQGGEPLRAIHYYVQAAEQSYEANDMDATLSCAERGLACGAQGEQRGALLSFSVVVYLGRERYAEIIALGTEALDLLPEGSRRWCRAFQHLFPAVTLSRSSANLAELASRFVRALPEADARGAYARAATWLSIMLAVTGEKDDARFFLRRAREVSAAFDESEMATWGHLRVAEAMDQKLIEEAPWSCMLSSADGRDALRVVGDQRYQSIASSLHAKALHDLGDRDGALAELRAAFGLAEQLSEVIGLVYLKTELTRLLARAETQGEMDEAEQLASDVIASSTLSLAGTAHGALAEIKRRRGDLLGAEAEARAACEAARPFPALSWDLIAQRMHILIELGRAALARSIGEEAVQHMERLGLAGYGELDLRLALCEARHGAGQVDAARAGLADTIPRLKKRLDDIPEAAARERYLTEVPACARLVALANEWLGRDERDS